MKIAIIYQSATGNTKLVAEAIREALGDRVVYCGGPKDGLDADLYFVGSWTDKGTCCGEIAGFLASLAGKKVACFGTAGFGGAPEYFQALSSRMKANLPASCDVAEETFFCQGKMPMAVRDRYVSMLTTHPDDQKLAVSVQNFDAALSHPDKDDLAHAQAWAKAIAG